MIPSIHFRTPTIKKVGSRLSETNKKCGCSDSQFLMTFVFLIRGVYCCEKAGFRLFQLKCGPRRNKNKIPSAITQYDQQCTWMVPVRCGASIKGGTSNRGSTVATMVVTGQGTIGSGSDMTLASSNKMSASLWPWPVLFVWFGSEFLFGSMQIRFVLVRFGQFG